MPLPIRPARDTQDGTLGKTYSDPFAFVPMSEMQRQIMEQEAAPYNDHLPIKEAKSYKSVGKASRQHLFEIWNNRDPEIIQAQTALRSEPSFRVPSNMSSSEIMRLVAEGLISRQDNNRVSFTRLGKQALNKEVMEQPNVFMSNKTRQKALKIAQATETSSTSISDATAPAQDAMSSLEETLKTSDEAHGQVDQQVRDLIAKWQQIQDALAQKQKVQQTSNQQQQAFQMPAMASKNDSRKKVEAAILDKIASYDIIEDSVKIQKLSNLLGKLDSGYLTEEEVNLLMD